MVAEPRGYDHADLLLADEPQSESSPNVSCSHPPPPALPSLLGHTHRTSLTLPDFPLGVPLVYDTYCRSGLVRELRAPWLAYSRLGSALASLPVPLAFQHFSSIFHPHS